MASPFQISEGDLNTLSAPPPNQKGSGFQISAGDVDSMETSSRDYFKPEQANFGLDIPNANKYQGEVADAFFKDSSPGRILSAFGHGAAEGWGAGTDPHMKEGVSRNDDYIDQQKDWSGLHKWMSKSVNNVFLRPAAVVADAAFSYGSSALGAAFGAATEATGQAGTELLGAAQTLQNDPDSPAWGVNKQLLAPALGSLGEIVHEVAPHPSDWYADPYTGKITVGAMAGFIPPEPFVVRATKARAAGHVGEGEEGYFNTVEVTPENLVARQKAAQEMGLPPAQLTIRPPESTVDVIARKVDPDTFNELDRLKDLQENLRLSLQAERTKRQQAIELGKPENHPELLKNQKGIEGLQENIQKTDEALRDLIPKTADAKERTQQLLDSDSKEGAAFRDYVQSQILDNAMKMRDLNQDASIATEHAQDLLPQVTPKEQLKVAKKQIDEIVNPQEPKAPTKGTKKPVQKATEGPTEAPEGTTRLYHGGEEPGAGGSRHFTRFPEYARDHGIGNKEVHYVDVPNAELEAIRPGFQGDKENGIAPHSNIELPEEYAKQAKPFEGKGGIEVSSEAIPEAIEGTGKTHVRGLAKDIEARAIEEGLTEGFGDLPEMKELNLKDQSERVAKFLQDDPQAAKRAALGHEAPPEGIHPIALLVGAEKKARESGDVDFLRQLAVNNNLIKRTSESARDLRILQERDRMDTNPVSRIQDIAEARQKNNQKAVTNEAFDIGEKLKPYLERTSTTVDDVIDFLKSIECDY